MSLLWTQSGSGAWFLNGSGSNRRAVVFADRLRSEFLLKYQMVDSANAPIPIIRSSQDGRTAIECGVVGANLVIRRVNFGNVAAATNLVAPSAHGLSAGVAYELAIRGVGNKIQLYLNGAASPTLQVDSASLKGQQYFGFVGDAFGMQVSRLEAFALVGVVQPATDVLCCFAGGELWASTPPGDAIAPVTRDAVAPDASVGAAEFFQKLYIVDGRRGFIYDPVMQTYTPWIPVAGALPGGTAGTNETTATGLVAYANALWAWGGKDDPFNWQRCKRGDPTNWDTGDLTSPDRSISGNTERGGKLGRPILQIRPFSDTNALFVCNGQMWRLTGDPAFGGYFRNVSYTQGGTGPDCAWAISDSRAVVLTPDGLVGVGLEGGPEDISRPRLRAGIESRSDAELFKSIVIQDRRRGGVLVFMPRRDSAAGQGVNFWIDDETGGPFPEQYPLNAGPLAACLWNGELVMLTRNGFVIHFDEDAEFSDLGVAIETIASLVLMNLGGAGFDTELSRLDVTLAGSTQAGAVSAEIMGGPTAEEAYPPASTPWIAKALRAGFNRILRTFRAPYINVRLYGRAVGKAWALDDVEVVAMPVPLLSPRGRIRAAGPTSQSTDQPGTGTGSGTSVVPPMSGSGSGSGTSIPSGAIASGTGTGTSAPPTGTGTGTGTGIPDEPEIPELPFGTDPDEKVHIE